MDDLNKRLNEAVEVALKDVRQIEAPVARRAFCEDGRFPYSVYGLAHTLDGDIVDKLTDHMIAALAQTAADLVAESPGCALVWRTHPRIADENGRRVATFRAAMVPLHLIPETVEA